VNFLLAIVVPKTVPKNAGQINQACLTSGGIDKNKARAGGLSK